MQNRYHYSLDFAVRDYECDLAGMVNNAVYLHYLEHTRHGFLRSRGVDFAELVAQGISLIVTRIEIDYLLPLRSRDRFTVGLDARRISRLRVGFEQEIVRLPDGAPAARALVVASAINAKGRPFLPEELAVRILG